MAIDPSIALNVRPVEPFDITKFQQLRNLAMQEQATQQSISASQAQEALARAQLPGIPLQQELTRQNIEQLRAQLPGVQATAEGLVRNQKFFTDVLSNPQEYTNADGSFNPQKFRNYSLKKGYLDKGIEVAQADLTAQAQNIANDTNLQTQRISLSNFYDNLNSHVAGILEYLPVDQRAGFLNTASTASEKIMPGSSEKLRNTFIATDPKTNKPIIDPKTGRPVINEDTIKAIRQSSITALQQQDLQYRFEKDFFTPEARDPDSAFSRTVRDMITRQTQGKIVPPKNLSGFELRNMPEYQQYIAAATPSQVVSNQARTQAASDATALEANINNLKQALSALDHSSLQPYAGTIIGQVGTAKYNQLIKTNPELARAGTAATAYNTIPIFADQRIDLSRETVSQAKARIEAGIGLLQDKLGAARKIAATEFLPSSLPSQPVSEPERPARPETRVDRQTQIRRDIESLNIIERERQKAIESGNQQDLPALEREINKLRTSVGRSPIAKVDMIDPQGVEYKVPEDLVNQALKQGLKRKSAAKKK